MEHIIFDQLYFYIFKKKKKKTTWRTTLLWWKKVSISQSFTTQTQC